MHRVSMCEEGEERSCCCTAQHVVLQLLDPFLTPAAAGPSSADDSAGNGVVEHRGFGVRYRLLTPVQREVHDDRRCRCLHAGCCAACVA